MSMNMKTIKEMVKNKQVHFVYFCNSELWYTTECGFEFPVPIEDVGTATMKSSDKAIFFMRWINMQIKVVAEYKRLITEADAA